MPFKPRIVPEEEALDSDFVLPEDLAELGDLLSKQAQVLASQYPAEQEAAFIAQEVSDEETGGTTSPARMPWDLVARIAAVALICVATFWFVSAGRDGSSSGDLARQPVTVTNHVPSASFANHDTSRQLRMGMLLLTDPDSQGQPISRQPELPMVEQSLESAVLKCGTGPESDGLLDLLESEEQPTLISM